MISRTDIEDMADEGAHVARQAAALDDKLVIPERFGVRRVTKMYADINKLRQAIRSEGTEAIQEAWDRVEECIDYAYGGCPGCRATHSVADMLAGEATP